MNLGPWIKTARSRFYFDPGQVLIIIEDIAHALSNICRFNGHSRVFYSVAQHSVLMAEYISIGYKNAALLHDAHEAYIGDVSSPLKSLLPDYQSIEQKIQRNVLQVFGLDSVPQAVKDLDKQMLITEMLALDLWDDALDMDLYNRLDIEIHPWIPEKAEKEFLYYYEQLFNRKEKDEKEDGPDRRV